jgi:uncharacterized protein DUF4190/putative regulator of septum formation
VYATPPAGARTAGRSGMAIAALVLGIAGAVLCFVFLPSILALIFGLVAARDIKRGAAAGVPKEGAGMARAGWILGLAGLVIGVVFVIIAVVTDDDDTNVDELRVGHCLQMDDLGDVVRDVPTVDCAERHDGEVYASGDLQGASHPGLTRVLELVNSACYEAFEPYVGATYEDSDLEIFYLYPLEQTWRIDRGYLCIAYPLDGSTLVGSVEGSGR